jgi:hypothetical protein
VSCLLGTVYFIYLFCVVQLYDRWGNVICHGKGSDVKEGHKSFPSGHTSCKLQFHLHPAMLIRLVLVNLCCDLYINHEMII